MTTNSDNCRLLRQRATVVLCGVLVVSATSAASAQKKEGPNEQIFQLLTAPGTDIGVVARDLKPGEVSSTGGAVLEEVRKDGPASRAGMRVGDIIVEFDGDVVRNQRQFSRLVQAIAPGRSVKATVIRGGQRTQLSLTVPPALPKQR